MQIDPRVSIWLNVLLAILTGITSATAEALWPGHGAQVMLYASFAILVINAVLHAIPSVSGPAGAAQFALGPKP